MIEQSAHQRLVDLIRDYIAKTPQITLRSCAREIGLSPSSLSGYLNAKRSLSQDMIGKIIDKIPMSDENRKSFKEELLNGDEFTSLNTVTGIHRMISHVYYFAILDIFDTEGVEFDIGWLSARFQIDEKVVSNVLEALIDYELVERTPEGRFRSTGKSYTMGDDEPRIESRSLFMSTLDVTRTIMDRLDPEARWLFADTSHMIFPIAKSKLPEAKRRIKTFRRSLTKFLATGDREEVYMLAVNLIPLTDVASS